MAPHSKLPIYPVTRRLFEMAVGFARKMNRDLRPTVGNRLLNDSFELVMLVYRANSARDKVPFLTEMLERAEAANLLLRLCMDLRVITQAEYAAAIELTTSIGKQANGWRKSQQ
jgi:hypothetical protein